MQVVKDPLKTKGARLSMELTIAGRYMVYAPTGEGVGVSRRLEDKERERLRRQTAKLELDGGGVIVRTAAHGAKREDFERELKYLHKLHEVLDKRVEETAAPGARLPGGRPVGARRARHLLGALRARDRRRRAAVPPAGLVLHAHRPRAGRARRAVGGGASRCSRPTGSTRRSTGVLSRRVDLPSGGYLIIDYAEALTVIDVNSGSFIGRGKGAGLEDTITKTNLEAAEEVVNQLRLRDIGGIIVIDFIDMARARNRDAVMKTLRKTLDEDRTKTFTAEISKLGLVEMTRQNVTEGVREIMSRPCPTCEGEGVIRSEETIAIEFERRLRDVAAEHPDAEAFLVQINPRVTHAVHRPRLARAARARGADRQVVPVRGLRRARRSTTSRSPSWAPARRSRSARCRSARAMRCSSRSSSRTCTTSTTRSPKSTATSSRSPAPPLVGEKRMVRIDQVGRTAASALLLDEAGEVVRPPARPAAARQRRRGGRRSAGAGPGRRQGRRAREARARGRRRAAPTARTPRHARSRSQRVADGDRRRARGRARARGGHCRRGQAGRRRGR